METHAHRIQPNCCAALTTLKLHLATKWHKRTFHAEKKTPTNSPIIRWQRAHKLSKQTKSTSFLAKLHYLPNLITEKATDKKAHTTPVTSQTLFFAALTIARSLLVACASNKISTSNKNILTVRTDPPTKNNTVKMEKFDGNPQ